MVPVNSAAEFLLSDAAATLSRQLKLRPQTDLALIFAGWIGAVSKDDPELSQIVSAIRTRTGTQQDFQTVAAMGFAQHGGMLDVTTHATLKAGLERLIGRQPFVDEIPMPFCSDAIGLLGVALGAQALADSALADRVGSWLRGFIKKIYEMEGIEDWQRCAFYAADRVLGEKIGLRPVVSEQAADVRVALSERGVMSLDGNTDQEETVVYKLLALTSTSPVSFERAALRLSALNWLTRAAPIVAPGRMTIENLVKLLERVPAGLRKWTWEKLPRTRGAKPCQWLINNEYHVQSLLWLLLAPIFPDIDDEQYLTKIAQKSPRSDLYIPSMRFVIEVKFVRPADSFQKIIDEISSDASLYNAMGNDCRDIVVFILDDSARSHEHDYLKQGLKRLPGISDVIVLSRPSDWIQPPQGS